MKIVNVILAVMILVLAGTAIFYASSLHQKRYLVKARGDKMRDNIIEFAGSFDKLLNTQYAAEITKDKLHHTKRENTVRESLKSLHEQFQAFETYQKTCIARLTEASETLTIGAALNVEALKTESKITDGTKKLNDGVKQLIARDNALIANLVQLGTEFNAPVTAETLRDINGGEATAKACLAICDNAAGLWTRIGTYEDTITKVARATSQTVPAYDGDYKAGFTAIQEKLSEISPKLTELLDGIKNSNDQIKTVNTEIKDRNTQITGLNTDVQDREKKVVDLNNILTLPAPVPAPWKESDHELVMSAIEGQVAAISPDWAFLVVSCGKNTKVKQPGTDNVLPAPIPGRDYYMIVKKPAAADPLYVGKVSIARIEDDFTVVNIALSLQAKEGIKVGDKVFFTPEETQVIAADKKNPNKKEAPEIFVPPAAVPLIEPGTDPKAPSADNDPSVGGGIFEFDL